MSGYDNCCFYHTTFIGYNEFKYIYESIEKRRISIDDYVHYGGLFEKIISDIKVYPDKFRFNLSQQYQYNGIAKNIQNALSRRINDFSLGSLEKLYDEDKLTHAIMCVIENNVHRYLGKGLFGAYRVKDLKNDLGEFKLGIDVDYKEILNILFEKNLVLKIKV